LKAYEAEDVRQAIVDVGSLPYSLNEQRPFALNL
jgi:hypothetical protein